MWQTQAWAASQNDNGLCRLRAKAEPMTAADWRELLVWIFTGIAWACAISSLFIWLSAPSDPKRSE
jgi:hypothetical protein